MTASQGHGYAAELANHRADLAAGKRAILAPEGLAKNGADRIVNGVRMQTKYCKDAASTMRACYGDDGNFKYLHRGKPMKIEVPPEQESEVVKLYAEGIRAGRMPGETNPNRAKHYVQAGTVTRDGAINIAKAGTIKGLHYDAERGVEIAGHAAGLSAGLAFAQAVWNGSSVEEAVEAACYTGLRVGGVSWATSVVSAQLGRSTLNQGMLSSSKWAAEQLKQYGGTLFKGASSNQLSKALHGNGLAVVATTLVTSSADLVRLFDSRISVGQLFKNVSTTAVGTVAGMQGMGPGALYGGFAGGAVGMYLGGPPGRFIGKFVGSVVGGLLGSTGAATVAQGATRWVMDGLIEDDAAEMLVIANSVFVELGQKHMLGKTEAQSLTASMAEALSGSVLRDMYASDDRIAFAKSIINPLIAPIVSSRKIVELPSEAEFAAGLYRLARRTVNDADTDKRILTNEDGSLQCDMPQDFVVYKELKKWNALPPVRHETDGVMIAAFRYQAVDTNLAADYLNSHHQRRSQKPDFVSSTEVAAVVVGDRDCYSYRTEIAGAAYRYNSYRVIRLFDEFILLGLMAKEEKLLLRHEDALDQMISSLTFTRVAPITNPDWPVFFSSDGKYEVTTPPGWSIMEDQPPPPEGSDLLFTLSSEFCYMWQVSRFVPAEGCVLEGGVRIWGSHMQSAYPDGILSVESMTLAGVEVAFGELSCPSKKTSIWFMHALLPTEDKHLIQVNAIMESTKPVGFREQCRDMVWRITKSK